MWVETGAPLTEMLILGGVDCDRNDGLQKPRIRRQRWLGLTGTSVKDARLLIQRYLLPGMPSMGWKPSMTLGVCHGSVAGQIICLDVSQILKETVMVRGSTPLVYVVGHD